MTIKSVGEKKPSGILSASGACIMQGRGPFENRMRPNDGLCIFTVLILWIGMPTRGHLFIHKPTTKCCSVQINDSFYISKRLYNKLLFITQDDSVFVVGKGNKKKKKCLA